VAVQVVPDRPGDARRRDGDQVQRPRLGVEVAVPVPDLDRVTDRPAAVAGVGRPGHDPGVPVDGHRHRRAGVDPVRPGARPAPVDLAGCQPGTGVVPALRVAETREYRTASPSGSIASESYVYVVPT